MGQHRTHALQQGGVLFDHFVGDRKHVRRYVEAYRPGRHDARVTGLAMASAVEPTAGHWPESPRTARQMSARALALRTPGRRRGKRARAVRHTRSEEHTSELQSH